MASTPRVLIAVVSCHARPLPRQMLRDTWIPRVTQGVDFRFFLGTNPPKSGGFVQQNDEVILDCDDSYNGLPSKVQGLFRWARARGYDFCMKLDEDVILKPKEWYEGFLKTDFSGPKNSSQPGYLCPWGFAYVLSRKAMEVICSEALPRSNNDEYWVTNALAAHGIGLEHDPRYTLYKIKHENKRALRAPPRPVELKEFVAGAFAWCILMPGDEPEKRAEYLSVWEKVK
jgi:Galactosyltransferase